MTIKGIKLRLYPNKAQQTQLLQMFGNDRFVWNQMLAMAKQRYQNNPSSKFIKLLDEETRYFSAERNRRLEQLISFLKYYFKSVVFH